MPATKTLSNKLLIIVCATLIVLAGIGAWVYTTRQSIAQKDRELMQQKQLKEYEQEQINARNKADNIQKCQEAANKTPSLVDGVACNKQ